MVLAVMVTTATFAQLVDLSQCEIKYAREMSVQKDRPSSAELFDPVAWRTQKRSYKKGFYYLKPTGTFYQVKDELGQNIVQTILTMPPFVDQKYVNMAPDPTTCKWYLNGIDYTWRADAEGNYVQSLTPRANTGVYVPELRDADETQNYVLASQNYNLLNPVMTSRQECHWLGLADDTMIDLTQNTLDTWYYGSGTYTDTYGTYGPTGAVYTSKSIVQDLPAPASPLYVEDMYIPVVSPLGERSPLKDGAVLTLNIRDQATGELLEAITATNDDYIYWHNDFEDFEWGALKFTKTEDNLFGLERVPFVIDRAVTLEISGLDEPGKELGFCMVEQFDCDADMAPGYIILENQETGDSIQMSFKGIAYGMYQMFDFVFLSLFDKAVVAETLMWDDASTGERVATISGYNVLQITRDGRECHTYGLEDTPYDLAALYVTTACPWYDDEKNENYSFDEVPSWITGWYVDDSYYDPENSERPSSVHYVSFTAEALPEGVESRSASFHLKGRGYTDDTLVTIVQTDAESTGIERVETSVEAPQSGATYSVSGQRVTDSAKGILVRDGRKFVRK